jgi:RNA polymerase sigma-70 factor (ECF subfamily)
MKIDNAVQATVSAIGSESSQTQRSVLASGPDSIEEAALLGRLRAGNERAYAEVMRKFGGRMLAVAQRLLGNEHDAQDAVQDAFLCAFRSLDKFAGESQLGTWLHKIAVNAALMKLRARRRRDERMIDDLLPIFDDTGHRVVSSPAAATWESSAAEIIENREMRTMIRKKIDQLPENYRIVLLLRDIEEMDTDQTARILGIRPGAVKTRLHRARMALRELLDREFVECPTQSI